MSLPSELPARVVDFVGYATTAMDKMAAELDAAAVQKKACADRIAQAVEALIAGERIEASQREKAAQMLQDPVKVLEVLTKVAVHRNRNEQQLGAPTGQTKRAAASPFVGGRNHDGERESDARFKRNLGF